MELEPYDPTRVHGHVLSLLRSSACSRSSPRRRWRSGSRSPACTPTARPTIVAGVVILVETMRAFGLERIEVSEHDILYGTAIAAGSGLRITPMYSIRANYVGPNGQTSFGTALHWVTWPLEPIKVGSRILPNY